MISRTQNPADMELWATRRRADLIWVKSQDALDLFKYIQNVLIDFF